MNSLGYDPVIRALFRAMAAWVVDGEPPPPSRYPRLDDGTLASVTEAGWPELSAAPALPTPQTPHRLDFGPDWSRGVVANEPPIAGAPFVVRVPAVDADGNDRAGIRLPEIEVPLATHTGWNYRHPDIGAPDRLSSELGAYFALPRTRAEHERTGDPRPSIEERYSGRDDYLGKIARAAVALVEAGLLLPDDLPGILERAGTHYDWATDLQ